MFDMLIEALPRLRSGESVSISTVTDTQGSSPRQPGASMMVLPDATVSGSVSGGCVEGAVYEISSEVLADGDPRAEQFGYSDEDAFAVGLTCGGILDIFTHRLTPEDAEWVSGVVDDVTADRPVAVATIIAHPDPAFVGRRLVVRPDSAEGDLGDDFITHAAIDDARGRLASGSSAVMRYGAEGERLGEGLEIFVSSFQPKPRLIVFGAIDFADAVATQGALLDFTVTVCDARSVFATEKRFPAAHEVVVQWPHRYLAAELAAGRIDRRTAICVLTHDPKFDIPLLTALLGIDEDIRPFFIGAMGSRRTHEERNAKLIAEGVPEDRLALLASPIGLDLKGRTPAETAVSILAEIVARRWGGSGRSLSEVSGAIHGS